MQKDLGQGPSGLPMSLRWRISGLCAVAIICPFTDLQQCNYGHKKQLKGKKVTLKGWGREAVEGGKDHRIIIISSH